MSGKIKILTAGAITAIILLIITLVIDNNGKMAENTMMAMPTGVVVPTRTVIKYFSDTGAIYISPTDGEYTVDWLIGNLRDKTPITTSAFTMNYDYKNDKFVVTIKGGINGNQQTFLNWMKNAGYDQIPSQFFTIE